MSALPPATNSPTPSGFTRGHWIFVSLAVVAVVLGVWFLFPTPAPDPIPPEKGVDSGLSQETRSQLFVLKHRALGYLENEQWFEAWQVLKEIETALPNDTFAPHNIAVAMCGKRTFGGNEPRPILVQDAESAAQRLLKIAPQDYISHLLAARIAMGCQQRDLALNRYRTATELAPQNPNPWFELYKSYDVSTARELPTEAIQALKKCYELAPDNLVVVAEYLNLLALDKNPDLSQAAETAGPVFSPLKKLIQNPKNDPLIYLEEVRKALPQAVLSKEAKDWNLVSRNTRVIQNVVMSTGLFQARLARLNPHPLDFIQFDFQSDQLQNEPHPAPSSAPIDVSFQAAADQIELPAPPLSIQVSDFNLDQHQDLFVLLPGRLFVYTNAPVSAEGSAKTRGAPWRILAELAVDSKLTGMTVADLDQDTMPQLPARVVPEVQPAARPEQPGNRKAGDGTNICQLADPDLVLYGEDGIQIWKNDIPAGGGQRTFVRMEKTGLEDVRGVGLVSVADFDLEGDLDLVVALPEGIALWSNREQFQFKNVSEDSVLPSGLRVRQIIAVDWDRDVDLDLILIGDLSTPPTGNAGERQSLCGVMRNQLHGRLIWEPALDGPKASPVSPISRAALLDADANASWDLVFSGSTSRLIRTVTTGPGNIRLLKEAPLKTVLPGGILYFDHDNDGMGDLLSWEGNVLRIAPSYLSESDSSSTNPKRNVPIEFTGKGMIQHCVPLDYDNDGDLDLIVHHDKGVQILNNEGGNKNHWLKVRLHAKPVKDGSGMAGQSRRVNDLGWGSLVELRTQSSYQPQVASGEILHFGLGTLTKAELLRVLWTNGVPQGHLDVQGNFEICEEQAPKGSCPFAYTWNGEHFEFYTDLLWNAPLGLQFAEGVIAPARAWEYLKISGDRMHLKDGKYVLQVTEELWEATYFDQIELLAIDHPAEIDIYSNEKVGPAEIAEYKIHAVRERHFPIAAQDQRGRNVLPTILQEDGEFTKTYDHRLRQGLTEKHWLELDLGKFDRPGDATLFLTGWMYPTETSISVSVSQNAENDQARPPSLWAPDAKGEWKEVRPFMGFPGGKTKTIAVNLKDVFAGDDHRLRIMTNMEFYWDHAFFTVGETPAEVVQTPLVLSQADLHFRGLSQHYWKPGNGPDQYDYRYVNRDPAWPPMQGKLTRYGDVLKLLTKQDDLLVVVGAGDEITLTFEPPAQPLPAGWKRDFIMHNVGWDKDADLHTIWGQTVEPLPFNAMSGYPFAPTEGPLDSVEYRNYLNEYQTREQGFSKFWRLVKERSMPPIPGSN